ncbi:hypothetical protein [Cyclobacterium marinum]|uniref:hypothetical protein n=1 Tax=Cyclobacterium marinum TaxID=104 RepID=UPI0011EEDEB8|nr:hypothetical protein [Cyclobacterium marinum]MBI0399462.1 hypothetical protein [Cyclobacterium marinum]
MNKLNQFFKNITPKKLIGIQIIYICLVIAFAYILGNQIPEITDEVEFSFKVGPGPHSTRYKHIFNQPLFEEIIFYFSLLDGIFIGYWFLNRD